MLNEATWQRALVEKEAAFRRDACAAWGGREGERPGRNGAQGIALSLATRDDMEKLNDIERLINPKAAKSAHNRPAGKPARKKPQAKGRWRNKKSNRARAA